MYVVTIRDHTTDFHPNTGTKIHCKDQKLVQGTVVQGINCIDSFSFTILPSNIGFSQLHEFTTLVDVFNTNKNRYEFHGRVLTITPSMNENGMIEKQVVCESYMAFLTDSQQEYRAEVPWSQTTVKAVFKEILDNHNSQVEAYKRFQMGTVDIKTTKTMVNEFQYKSTWETLKEVLIDELGGELRFRVEETAMGYVTYLDYRQKIGEEKTTEIALSKNMKSITQEKDPSSYISTLIPLGKEMSDGKRFDLSKVYQINQGSKYIIDESALTTYGTRVGIVTFDDIPAEDEDDYSAATRLKNKGDSWLTSNNKVLVKYSITALDLSLLGLDIDDFTIYNSYPIKNRLLGIDDVGRISKKNINICEEVNSTIEIGDTFKTLTEIQNNQASSMEKNVYIATKKATSAINRATANKVSYTDYDAIVSMLNLSTEAVVLSGDRLSIIGEWTEENGLKLFKLFTFKVGTLEFSMWAEVQETVSGENTTYTFNRLVMKQEETGES